MKHSVFLGVLLFVAPANHSGSSGAIIKNVSSVYRGEGAFSTSGDTMSTLGDITNTLGDVQYTRGLP